MQLVIEQDNDGQFHWHLVADDGAELAVSSVSFGPRRTRVAPQRTCGCTPGLRPMIETRGAGS
jgi:hypothetical protein